MVAKQRNSGGGFLLLHYKAGYNRPVTGPEMINTVQKYFTYKKVLEDGSRFVFEELGQEQKHGQNKHEISGYHGGERVDCGRLGCDTV
jgi:hypothetical protein